VYIGDSGMAAVDAVRNVFLYLYPGSSGIGKRVFGNCREIAGGDQVCEMLGAMFLS